MWTRIWGHPQATKYIVSKGIDNVCDFRCLGIWSRPHPRSVKALLQVLFSILDFMIDTTELDQKARQMDATIKEIGERIQQSTVSENGRSMYA